MTYIGITNPVEVVEKWGSDLKLHLSRLPDGVIPQVGLSYVGGNDTRSGLDQQVAEGKYDDQIAAFVSGLKNLDVPAFVRIGYEFEGSWKGYSPEPFKEVFIKITKESRENDTNAVTVWCSGGGSAGFVSHDQLMKYYPGDEWVDWWGIDIFSPEEITDSRLEAFYDLSE